MSEATTATGAQAVDDELSRCVIRLLLKEPFFGHVLASVVRGGSERTPTAAVAVADGKVQLLVNPTFFLRTLRRREERIAVIKHETLHLLFKHVLRLKQREQRADPHLWNVAADLVVNQYIGEPWRLPDDAITLRTFPDLGLKANDTIESYYASLLSLRKQMRGGPDGPRHDRRKDRSEGASGPAPRRITGGDDDQVQKRGKGASSRSPSSAPRSADALRRIEETWHSDHRLWGDDEDSAATRAAESVLEGMVARAAQRSGPRSWGSIPGPLRELVEATLARRRSRVDWRRVVRQFSSSSRRTQIVGTYRRASRRYGTFPGVRVKRRARLAIAVDTSGSVRDEELSAFFSEIHGLWRQGADVTVFECDARVQREYAYSGRFPRAVAGRGGTLYDPVFERLRRDRMERWDGVIYLTDGHAPAPRIRPPCRVLWVLTPDGHAGPHLRPGVSVRLRG